MTVDEGTRSTEPTPPGTFWDTYRPSSGRGLVAIASVILLLLTPSLAYFVSNVFLLLFPLAWALSIAAHSGERGLTRNQRLLRTGQTLAFNGLVLIVAMFVVGFVGDFILDPKAETLTTAIGAGFTTIHVLFGTGLVIRDVILE